MTMQSAIRRRREERAAALRLRARPVPTVINGGFQASAANADDAAAVPRAGAYRQTTNLLAAACLAAGVWSYWPTMASLASTWSRIPDYSHGFLVIPLAAFFLWMRRDSCPQSTPASPLLAGILLAMSLLLRGAGDVFYFTFLDGWSLLPWAAACLAALGGWPLVRWSMPAVLFLFFMVPLPFAIENDLSGPLQRVATKLSTMMLQALGVPAFAEGNTIALGNSDMLEVAQACSGLRLFIGIIAITYAYVVVLNRPWWEKLVLIGACVPIAIFSNAVRIVATGCLYQLTANHMVRDWIHEGAGIGMILFSAVLFLPLLWFLRMLVKEEEVMDISAVVKHSHV